MHFSASSTAECDTQVTYLIIDYIALGLYVYADIIIDLKIIYIITYDTSLKGKPSAHYISSSI